MNEFTMFLHPHNEYISNFIRKYGLWEPYTSEILLEICRKNSDSIFIDIGANLGWFSLLAASRGMSVIAFEPIKSNYDLFLRSIKNNNYQELITVHRVALGDVERKMVFNVAEKNMGLCSTRELIPTDHSTSEICIVKKLDSFLLNNTKNLIIKIDTEETELSVLRGMVNTLKSDLVTHIIIEISRYQQELFDILLMYGFVKAVNIGYDPDKVRKNILDTDYLKNPKYHTTLEYIRKEIEGLTDQENQQRMILFLKVFK